MQSQLALINALATAFEVLPPEDQASLAAPFAAAVSILAAWTPPSPTTAPAIAATSAGHAAAAAAKK